MILFDAAYESYIADPSLPRSIYEIPGARSCAIELRSFSKRAGFTGVRCAFMVIPKDVTGGAPNGDRVALNKLWARRHFTTRSSTGASYVVQWRRGERTRRPDSRRRRQQITFYMENAKAPAPRRASRPAGFTVFGGVHAPYLWLRTRDGASSWDFFDRLLNDDQVSRHARRGVRPRRRGVLPAVRSAFNSRANIEEAIGRIRRGSC